MLAIIAVKFIYVFAIFSFLLLLIINISDQLSTILKSITVLLKILITFNGK